MKFDSLFNELTDINAHYHFNGALAVLTPSQTLYQHASGYASFERHTPFTDETIMGIGSLTKQFTATAILQLVEAGKLSLNQSLKTYLPDYQLGDKVTIRQLLNMDSGIPDYTDLIVSKAEEKAQHTGLSSEATEVMINKILGTDFSLKTIVSMINGKQLDFKPGSQFAYSNTNYALLTEILEQVTGTPYAAYIQEHILTPLTLSNTHVGTEKSQVDSYLYQGSNVVNLGRGNHQLGDGAMVTNLVDLKKWACATTTNALLSSASQHLCFNLKHEKYGMGWMKINSWYWHSGQILGYWSDFFLSPEHDLAMVYLYNVSPTDEIVQDWLKASDDWRERFLTSFNPK
ncbi:MAG: beta-lactamase family protein [Furfurilactobacillus sp.]|jgi:CubicO group peptidase (beta-lactamase class C family)|uniref:Beta-lactamase family protein n=1 Tax=Furfurilactobacillus milii TaxID=2888272 RepID=A0ABT6DBS6_9LACO|nr:MULTISPECIES: serine hydrolase domain-containing protein [Furfurilactobacillus]QLE67065.1 PbpE protein [Furfurilactobacillus rossiae]MCF6161324.1 beta-lactamase family protein [Furfurilactobacillus milii]MCF6163704.1 beta-lactamase family protein [Furfurilactobacillus milii]MCF6418925.1 beta-lactamase family protein [Furfurilactobacillus milii]MCH4011263.1 beta-lactamase family protein [Furfurilactobacillus sp.]